MMTTSFSSLPIVSIKDVSFDKPLPTAIAVELSQRLYQVFSTTGFAYLVDLPLSFDHNAVFDLARSFFELPAHHKMQIARRSFRPESSNTYRGYFPVQPLSSSDNFKEGLDFGSSHRLTATSSQVTQGRTIKLDEPNVWPSTEVFNSRQELEQLYDELQKLSSQLLSLLAMSLGKESNFFDAYLNDSLSTLRLLHYPPMDRDGEIKGGSVGTPGSTASDLSNTNSQDDSSSVKLSCTPHTDSGILTLLHQDTTGGLEVKNGLGQWIPAPYVPGSIVVNVGDLMAEVSGGRFVATMHRVRSPGGDSAGECRSDKRFGRFSVPFFFEPGEDCIVRSVDGNGHGIVYGEHVRRKMRDFVEFQDFDDNDGHE